MAELGKKVNIKRPIDVHNVTINADPFRSNAYVISLPLDSDPSYIWQMLFEEALESSLDFWDRKTLVVGKELKLITTQEGLEEKLKWLEGVVDDTNKRVEEYNKKAKWAKQAEERREYEQTIREALSKWSVRGPR